jgi:hypothetical protein
MFLRVLSVCVLLIFSCAPAYSQCSCNANSLRCPNGGSCAMPGQCGVPFCVSPVVTYSSPQCICGPGCGCTISSNCGCIPAGTVIHTSTHSATWPWPNPYPYPYPYPYPPWPSPYPYPYPVPYYGPIVTHQTPAPVLRQMIYYRPAPVYYYRQASLPTVSRGSC